MAHRFLTAVAALLITMTSSNESMATERAYEPTPVGEIVVRELSAGRWLTAGLDGKYFDESETLFRRLFDYIKDREVSMTVPVEGDVERAVMRFYAGSQSKGLDNSETVGVVQVPARRVVSIGARGAYSRENIHDALTRLQDWLSAQDQWVRAGEPYGVYWNGPFTPWFMKRFEVHLPVEAVDGAASAESPQPKGESPEVWVGNTASKDRATAPRSLQELWREIGYRL